MEATFNDYRLPLRLGSWLIAAVSLVLLAWVVSRAIWVFLPSADLAPRQSPSVVPAASTSPTAGSAIDVTTLHLFGNPGQTETFVAELPETELDLTLIGTLAADDADAGIAIVAEADGTQGYFSAGQQLPGGAQLTEIHGNRVVLNYRGRREVLNLERDRSNMAATSGATNRALPGGQTSSQSNAPTGRIGAVDWQNARANSVIDIEKLNRIASGIQAMPHMENGVPVGIRLSAARDSQMLSTLGLRSSDVVTSVNGVPLTDPGRQMELMQMLNNQSQFEVRIRRNGRDMTLNVDASKLQK